MYYYYYYYSQVGSGLLQSLVKDIVAQLGQVSEYEMNMTLSLSLSLSPQVTASKVTADVFSPGSVTHKMSRDYFLLLGAVSFHNSSLLYYLGTYGP